MPIIGKVGRKSLRLRLFDIFIHALLLGGSFTIVYPFLLMLSGSVKSGLDMKSLEVVPKYFYDDATLFQKHIQTKYNDQLSFAVSSLKRPYGSFEDVKPPEFHSESLCRDFEEFLARPEVDDNPMLFGLGMAWERGVEPMMLRKFKGWLKSVYGDGDSGLYRMNADCGTEFTSWDEVRIPAEYYLPRRTAFPEARYLRRIVEFKMLHSGSLERYYFDLDGYFADHLRREVSRTLEGINAKLGTDYRNWMQLTVPRKAPSDNPALAQAWANFVRNDLSPDFIVATQAASAPYRVFLKERYKGDVKALNKAYGTGYAGFDSIPAPSKTPPPGAARIDWSDFITMAAPLDCLSLSGTNFAWRSHLAESFTSPAEANEKYARGYRCFEEVQLPASLPSGNMALRKDWKDFVRLLGERGVDLKRSSMFEYKEFLVEKYETPEKTTDFGKMSSDYLRRISSRGEVPHYLSYPESGPPKSRQHYGEAVRERRFETMLVIKDSRALKADWDAFLKERHGSIASLNREYGLLYESFDAAPMPLLDWEWWNFLRNRGKLRLEFAWRNYAMVIDTVVYNGRAAWNTLVYCGLSILAALLVNPMAAYALSRFKPPSTHKLLLLMMMTLGFPPIVIGIPSFLMIKSMGLLNTYSALILPGLASGFSIYLLKGFFDSLPKELFECATLDGAGEWTIFWHVAMSLSKPILAVTALQTFIGAYGNFMMAFLVCQNPKMWTMMVYLYQLQQRSSPSVAFAALVVSAIPTFLLFVLCQNLIIKGIVVPSEK